MRPVKSLVVIFGKKQSGKSTLATAIYGYYLTNKGVIPNANFTEDGTMSVEYDKNTKEGIVFDIDTDDNEIKHWYSGVVWPHICHVSFADALKETAINLFGLDRKKIYGSNEDKDSPTHIKWVSIKKFLSEESQKRFTYKSSDRISYRHFLEIFGSDICRALDDECHVRSAWDELNRINPEVGIVPDGRFPNELEFVKKLKRANPKLKVATIFLERDKFNSDAPSEKSLEEIDKSLFDLVIPNNDMTVAEKNNMAIAHLVKYGILGKSGITIDHAVPLSS